MLSFSQSTDVHHVPMAYRSERILKKTDKVPALSESIFHSGRWQSASNQDNYIVTVGVKEVHVVKERECGQKRPLLGTHV